MELTRKQEEVLDTDGHLLVSGGPGSGKTTVSILKAAAIAGDSLLPGQRILFLSFSRAAVARVIEAIGDQGVSKDAKKRIEVDTYHSLFWRILKTHGYLLGLPRKLSVLTPPNEAVALSTLRSEYGKAKDLSEEQLQQKIVDENEERRRLAKDEGKVCFSIFGELVAQLLISSKIKKLLSDRYPFIILDEFQDTNQIQWQIVQSLGENSKLVALADPEQRIFDFIGADPNRLNHFREAYDPVEFDFEGANHRSGATDISIFGNDILRGEFSQKEYRGMSFEVFPHKAEPALSKLITEVYSARTRLINSGRDNWSLAILVPTRALTRMVSEAFVNPPGKLAPINHTATLDMEAAILSAEVIAFLMQDQKEHIQLERLVDLLSNYYNGKGGDNPSQSNLEKAASLKKGLDKYISLKKEGRKLPKNSVISKLNSTLMECADLEFTGCPDKDWMEVRNVLAVGQCKRLQEVAEDAKNIRLLNRGAQLRSALAEEWVTKGRYENALDIARDSFIEDHFATKLKPESGVVVMNMHKAKGKQFDEVIIFEGWPKIFRGKIVANPGRIVRGNLREHILDSTRQNFRVSVTRAKERTTILTPKNDPCVLLCAEKG